MRPDAPNSKSFFATMMCQTQALMGRIRNGLNFVSQTSTLHRAADNLRHKSQRALALANRMILRFKAFMAGSFYAKEAEPRATPDDDESNWALFKNRPTFKHAKPENENATSEKENSSAASEDGSSCATSESGDSCATAGNENTSKFSPPQGIFPWYAIDANETQRQTYLKSTTTFAAAEKMPPGYLGPMDHKKLNALRWEKNKKSKKSNAAQHDATSTLKADTPHESAGVKSASSDTPGIQSVKQQSGDSVKRDVQGDVQSPAAAPSKKRQKKQSANQSASGEVAVDAA